MISNTSSLRIVLDGFITYGRHTIASTSGKVFIILIFDISCEDDLKIKSLAIIINQQFHKRNKKCFFYYVSLYMYN